MRHLSGNKLFTDEFFGSLNPVHRLLWLGLILTIADDQGRLMDNVTLMRSLLFPYDKNITDREIDKGLALFEAKHKIVRYISGTNGSGRKLIQIVNWWRYQVPQWARESQYPAPAKWIDRVRTHKEGHGSQPYLLNWDKPGGFILVTKPLPSGKPDDKVAASKPQASLYEDEDDLKKIRGGVKDSRGCGKTKKAPPVVLSKTGKEPKAFANLRKVKNGN